jgi:hypothetical protein
MLRGSHSIIGDFINANDDSIGPDGIRVEYAKVEDLLNGGDISAYSEKSEIRYGETAYTIWALGHRLGRWDILTANIGDWGNGDDSGGSTRFRNVEFECQVALRFLEEGYKVEPIEGNHQAEMVVAGFFTIECKRQYDLRGLLRNSIKARDQIKTSGNSGVLVVNIDELSDLDVDPCDDATMEAEFDRVARVAEYGFGQTDSELVGLVIEYVADKRSVSESGSFVHTVHNCSDPTNGLCHSILDKTVHALTGGDDRDIRDPQVDETERYQGDYAKEDESDYLAFYNAKINV